MPGTSFLLMPLNVNMGIRGGRWPEELDVPEIVDEKAGVVGDVGFRSTKDRETCDGCKDWMQASSK